MVSPTTLHTGWPCHMMHTPWPRTCRWVREKDGPPPTRSRLPPPPPQRAHATCVCLPGAPFAPTGISAGQRDGIRAPVHGSTGQREGHF